ncbi:S-adenosyl-L-methionine-dependent methyltransferase [Glarea lozoyensis ATCC 20868]|uniref:S-adenosyl-L-methionine-dependent methyltransferase n=1 Tax=Glarea lozoyensis (strain ATCC 20868 / MF5171) TaxID=1116229 RepID=S3CHE2_GLAL2|nr:S-adenosyl-L-methionine-dependent methyltransferase [Glarea lozoyensis ATCC 20868]EPE24714.1 S-adenosyl-L-methionine-dependent methyltransferase [Glarea lozoyensis ATCC 20868]
MSENKSQNIYDDPAFYSQYEGLDRQVHGLAYAPEWPVLQSLMPDLQGANVLDLGCGSGFSCRYTRSKGAASALGIDVSATMIAHSKDHPADDAITYEQRDLEDNLELPDEKFDFAFSSLAFHYVANFEQLIPQIFKALKPGANFLFTTIHPIRSAGEVRWIEHLGKQQAWPVTEYLNEGPRTIEWLNHPVKFRHRTIQTYFEVLLGAGFQLLNFKEWSPKEEELKEFPFWSLSGGAPMFMVFKFLKPKV